MNARLSLLAAAFLSFALCAPAGAADQTWTYTPNKDNTGVQTIDDITITPTYTWVDDSSTSFANSDSSLAVGATRAASSHINYNILTSSSGKKVSKVVVTAKTTSSVATAAAGNKARVTVSVGNTALSFSGDNALTNTHTSLVFTPTEPILGNVVVDINNPLAKNNSTAYTLYVKSIVITLKEETGRTQLDTPTSLSATSTNYFGFTLVWDPVTHATNGYTVTLSPAEGNSGVTVSGTTATMTGLAEGTPYTASVVAIGDGTGTDDSEAATLDVTTLADPVVNPALTESNVSASSFTVSWPAQPSGVSFAARAWTLVPADVATEDFVGYPDVKPTGWTFNNLSNNPEYKDEPVAFNKAKTVSMWMSSPKYDADVSSVSFRLRANLASSSTLVLSGSPDGETWTPIESWTGDNLKGSGVKKTAAVATTGVRYLKWTFEKDSGNVFIGHVSVNGTSVGKQPSYLTGYGPDATAVAGTSVTISNPVAGETNYIEVTATGLSGRTATTTLPVFVPGYPSVISVK